MKKYSPTKPRPFLIMRTQASLVVQESSVNKKDKS